jgi:hypothetical protein
MIKCEIDEKEFKNGGVLARYLKEKYSLTYREYYHKYIVKTDDIPKCKCGCGIEMKWTNVGYKDYAKGHYSRVKNNWGHNISAQLKSAETRRQQYASGEREVWNKGLTIDDERVKNNGVSISNSFSDDRKSRYATIMSQNRKNGVVPTLFGPDSSRWKGGTSEVNNIARSNKRLYDEWKYPILIRDGFKCVECGNSKKLHIHHDKEKFCEIVEKHMPDQILITDFELKKSIAEKIVDYHIQNKVSGITLCGKCHEKYHPSLNFD